MFSIPLAVLFTAGALAQAPDFAGRWTLVPDPTGAGGRGGIGALGEEATITQDATSMTIRRTTQMGNFTTIYKLDGSESKNTLTIQGNAIEQTSKTKWDGGTLRVETSMSLGGSPVQVTMAMSFDPSGNLIVESTRPDFQGGGAPITAKTTYKKNP